jgi:phage FluMu protein Com
MVEMKIRCPACKNQLIVHGDPQEKIFITCPKCNTHGEFTIPSDDFIRSTPNERNTGRPRGVTIVAILAIIGAVYTIFSLVMYVGVSTLWDLIPLNFLLPLLLICILAIVLFFSIAYGFWKGLRWSWFAAIILLSIGIILQIIIVPLQFFMLSSVSSAGLFNSFFLLANITTVIIFIALYGLILFYLTRCHVRTYFNVGQPGDIISTMKKNRKIAFILVSVFVVSTLILVWGFTPTGSTGTITLISLSQTPENPQAYDDITITAEITGGSPFGGAGAYIKYSTYFGHGSESGTKPMESIGNNKYKATFHGSNGTEIWCLITSGNHILADHTIQVGHIERSNITSLAIRNITQTPETPTSETTSITIAAEITSTVNVTEVKFIKEVISQSGSSSSSFGMKKTENNTYSETITPFGSRFSDVYQNQKFTSGTIIYYRIAAQDESGNTAVITNNIII